MSKPCRKCACSGWYVSYGGYCIGGVLIPCPMCNGSGWLRDTAEGVEPE